MSQEKVEVKVSIEKKAKKSIKGTHQERRIGSTVTRKNIKKNTKTKVNFPLKILNFDYIL